MVETTISVQTLGIGVSAFIATLVAAFLLINAYRENVARAFAWGVAALAFWAWFGFFSATAAEYGSMELARSLRAISILGNVLFVMLFVRFAFVYKNEHTPLTKVERRILDLYLLIGAGFVALLLSDAFLGTQTAVGDFPSGRPSPYPQPMLDLFIIYYFINMPLIILMMRKRFSMETGAARRGGIILVSTMMISVVIGAFGFLPWYGINLPILAVLRALAVPNFAIGAFYAMNTHNIFNFRVAAANFFVFAIWSFLFFRILLNPSFQDARVDIYLLGAFVVLGVLLIRSFTKELDDRLLIERSEKERAIEQARAEFISIAAHQLRTPLAGVRWTFNVLESQPENLSGEQKELISKAKERTNDVVERVNEMLRAARLTDDSFTITRTRQDIRPIIKDCVAVLEGSAQMRKLSINLELPRKSLTASIDYDKFSIALQNLIDNAIKYTKSGEIAVSADTDGADIVVRVRDTGMGISEEDRKHMFEKFYRSEKATKMFTDGSGLGLFIVKKIIDGHDGTVSVESTGKGTTFIVRIPAVKNGS